MSSAGRLKLFSPAKINLTLRVLGKRPDGFHELETLFERVSLADTITLSPAASGIRVLTNSPGLPRGPKNLAWRAAKLLADRCQVKKGVVIRIQKRIPVAAGLGGGSSNAATVLLGLNRLWKLRLSRKTLLELAAQLGSDVPFFILETSFAVGTGRGEILRKIQAPPGRIWHCLVKPPFGISTHEAYQGLKGRFFSQNSPSLTPQNTDAKMLLHSIQKGDSTLLENRLVNSLEHTQNKRVTNILKIKKALKNRGAFASLMSGSGSSVFGLFLSKDQAARAARSLKQDHKSWQVFVASTF